eukprot:EG_transcript_55763
MARRHRRCSEDEDTLKRNRETRKWGVADNPDFFEPRVQLRMWDFSGAAPALGTGTVLRCLNEMQLLTTKRNFDGVCLSPKAALTLSPADRRVVLGGGLAVVDCPYEELETVPWAQ